MNPERWLELQRLYHEAAALSHDERDAWLAECGDPELRVEVSSLLDNAAECDSFLERSALDEAANAGGSPAPSMVGRTVDRFTILERIGAGGMGEVYLARDLVLQRDVALKFLLPAHAGDAKVLLREARHAACLSHPHVCTVHEVGSFDGRPYLAMEYVDGVTLSAVLRGEPLAPQRVLRYGRQIAAAMAHAHDRGVLHKDLKATNVLLTRDDTIKVVDFGIARRLGPGGVEQQTEGRSLSRVVAGTPAYMAPEVLRGTPADVRGDIWSLGVLLYEMAAGVRPFAGTSAFDVIAAIVQGAPRDLATAIPAGLQPIIRRCLAVDPGVRFQTAAELCAALEALSEGAITGADKGARSGWAVGGRRWRILAAASLVLLLPLTVSWRGASPRPAAPGSDTTRGGSAASLAILPFDVDGAGGDELGLGIADAIATRLAGLPRLQVAPSTAVRDARLQANTAAQVGRALGVAHVLAGTVRTRGDQCDVMLQLVRVQGGFLEWGDPFPVPKKRLSALDTIVAEKVTRALKVPLTEDASARLVRQDTLNAAAHSQYVAGRISMLRHERADRWLPAFEEAVRLDPGYARAWAALAHGYAHKSAAGTDPQNRYRAIEAAKTALGLDSTLGEAHEALSTVYRFSETDWDKTIVEADKALELDPRLQVSHHNKAVAFYHLGLFDLSDQESLAGIRANAQSRYEATLNRARNALYWGQYSAAEKLALGVDASNDYAPHWIVAEARYYLDRIEQSEHQLRELMAQPAAGNTATRARASLASLLAGVGRRAEAQRTLAPLLAGGAFDHHVTYRIATTHAQLGQAAQAVTWLKRSADNGFPCYPWFEKDSQLDRVRQDASFQRLMAELRDDYEVRRARYKPVRPAF